LRLGEAAASSGRDMPQTAARWPVIAKTVFQSQVSPYEICNPKVALGRVFLRVVCFSSVSVILAKFRIHLHFKAADEVWKPSKKRCS
jgi:hypothetical protein